MVQKVFLGLTLTAFKYTGALLNNTIDTLASDINESIDTINTTTIPAIEADIASLKITAAENELFTDTISIPAVSGDISPVTVDINGDKTQSISGSVSAEGTVVLTVPGEVLAVKQQVGTDGKIEEIYPDMVFTDSTTATLASTVLTADYGKLSNIQAGTSWIITFRAIPKKEA